MKTREWFRKKKSRYLSSFVGDLENYFVFTRTRNTVIVFWFCTA